MMINSFLNSQYYNTFEKCKKRKGIFNNIYFFHKIINTVENKLMKEEIKKKINCNNNVDFSPLQRSLKIKS